ncbi:MAG: hypothetical protein Unbinned4294contig1002_1, partial [Prokaryotic dsDNA virus sp.]
RTNDPQTMRQEGPKKSFGSANSFAERCVEMETETTLNDLGAY